jgi:hypothetical protein
MQDSSSVQIAHGGNQLPADQATEGQAQGAPLDDELVQIRPPRELHHHQAGGIEQIVGPNEANNVGVTEFLQNGDFPLSVDLALFVLNVDILNRHVGFVVLVVGLAAPLGHPDHAKGALAEDFQPRVLVLRVVGPILAVVQVKAEHFGGHAVAG